MKKIKTHLLSGAGNTFHIVDREKTFGIDEKQMSDLAKKICNKNFADGCIFLLNQKDELSWGFFNNDGSAAEMCGNATRCVGFYVKNITGSKKNSWNLKTIAGLIKIDFLEKEKFKITMTAIQKGKSELGFFCDTGVPHLVIETDKILITDELKKKSKVLRESPEFFPKGTNVTYVGLTENAAKVKAISYERGVEDFTQACGTGAVAAALYNLTKRAVKQTEVEMPGGTLIMDLADLKKPTMTGPAILLGSYEYEI